MVAPVTAPAVAPAPAAAEKVTVLGEVESPGDYPWREGMKVADAVAQAGGYTYRAKKSVVYLQRKDQAEPAKHPADGLTLSPGDRVKIAERFF
jgi:protein involved in polysaccharide export with SLBB domain